MALFLILSFDFTGALLNFHQAEDVDTWFSGGWCIQKFMTSQRSEPGLGMWR